MDANREVYAQLLWPKRTKISETDFQSVVMSLPRT